ncbi:hypothetical protein BN996_03121 [Haloferax massiliensis]|uniref:Uncharacterized protein n=1 Tax=Haloferax massiliensis TaxID=1476858 RepID=A0A0D6JUR4_9EURY|nr:hypothetical protein BN996_03121 [Haloferax massiliensis]
MRQYAHVLDLQRGGRGWEDDHRSESGGRARSGGAETAERDALREFEDRFEENVSLTDLREALMKVGLQHLDETEECLEEWGYGMTFD